MARVRVLIRTWAGKLGPVCQLLQCAHSCCDSPRSWMVGVNEHRMNFKTHYVGSSLLRNQAKNCTKINDPLTFRSGSVLLGRCLITIPAMVEFSLPMFNQPEISSKQNCTFTIVTTETQDQDPGFRTFKHIAVFRITHWSASIIVSLEPSLQLLMSPASPSLPRLILWAE